jgi:transposase
VIWDGSRPHRSRLVRDYLDSLNGHIQIAFLPPYAPDLNPVEYLWAWLKRHALANYCPNNLNELHVSARNKLLRNKTSNPLFLKGTPAPRKAGVEKLKSAQKRPSIIAACWMQASLW